LLPGSGAKGAADFAALAHDLRTPLSIIMLDTAVLGEIVAAYHEPGAKDRCDRIQHNAEYMARLVADLLDLAARIERVIAKLIANALAYTPPDSLISVEVEARGRAHVSVSDTEPGLSAEDARTVFDRYRQGRGAGTGSGSTSASASSSCTADGST
jgi:signal transduction histidine kinase